MKARTKDGTNSVNQRSKQAHTQITKPTPEEIPRLAYHFYERDGKTDGKDLEHWFNAESMIESQFGYGRDHTEHDFSKAAGNE